MASVRGISPSGYIGMRVAQCRRIGMRVDVRITLNRDVGMRVDVWRSIDVRIALSKDIGALGNTVALRRYIEVRTLLGIGIKIRTGVIALCIASQHGGRTRTCDKQAQWQLTDERSEGAWQ